MHTDVTRLRKGDTVVISEYGRLRGIYSRVSPMRTGIVVSLLSRHHGELCSVRWDGNLTASSIHRNFIRKVILSSVHMAKPNILTEV